MFEETTIRSDSGSLNVGVGPKAGPPLLLLHGVLRKWTDFVPVLPSLACRWHVHALDFRGHGKSARVPGRYRVIDYVEDALSVIQSFDEPVVVYGHSLGGMVAAAAAGQAAEKVRAVILEDPPFETMGARQSKTILQSLFDGYQQCLTDWQDNGPTDIDGLTDRLMEIPLHAPDQLTKTRLGDARDRAALRFAASGLAQMDADVLTPIVAGQWLEGYDVEAVISAITCPTLVLQADDNAGGMLTDKDTRRLESSVADCSWVHFPGQGHLLHWSATTALLSATTAFLESLR